MVNVMINSQPHSLWKHLQQKISLISLLSIMLVSVSYAQSVTVKTDRQTVEMGDIINLVIETDFQVSTSKLDLAVLEDQFDIISRQQSNQIQIINGNFNSFSRWQLRLIAKQVGNLMIPPIEINGVKSKPLPITVNKAKHTTGNEPYFLEAQTDLSEIFVQQQLIYTLRFYHQGSLINGNVRPPKFADAQIETLKEQSVFGKTINGKAYTVYEWQYAVFPQSSGELNIPSPVFTGLLHLRGRQKGVQARTDNISIAVMPALNSPDTNNPYWLPAKQLKIKQQWLDKTDNVRVGDSLGREISIVVDGIKAVQLPKLVNHNGSGYKLYIDQEKDSQQINSKGIRSTRIISQAIIPNKAGKITLPAEKITWWNTQTQHFETTEVPSQSLMVLPALQTTNSSTDTVDNSALLSTPIETSNNQLNSISQQIETNSSIWIALTAILALVLVVFAWMLWQTRQQLKSLTNQQRQQEHNTNIQKQLASKSNQAWSEQPAGTFYQTLLTNLRQNDAFESLQQLPEGELKQLIDALERHLFANEALEDKTLANIVTLFNEYKSDQKTASQASHKPGELQTLYR